MDRSMPIQNMIVLLLGLVLVISGFYVAWNAPQSGSEDSLPAGQFIIAVDGFDCEVGTFLVRGGRLTSDISVSNQDDEALQLVDGVVAIPGWPQAKGPLKVSYSWAGSPGSQIVDPARHCSN